MSQQLVWASQGSHKGAQQHAATILSIDDNMAEIKWASTGQITQIPKGNISYELPSRRRSRDSSNNGTVASAAASVNDTLQRDKPITSKSQTKKSNGTKMTTSSANKNSSSSPKRAKKNPVHSMGKVIKYFKDDDSGEMKPFSGDIKSYDEVDQLYKIEYEDGDEEEVDLNELKLIIVVDNNTSNNGQKYTIGTTVSKVFEDPETGERRPFSGKVISYDSKKTLYRIRYEDDDEEEIGEIKVSEILDQGGSGKVQAGKKKRKRDTDDKATSNKKKKKPRMSSSKPRDDSDDEGYSKPVELVTSRSGRKMKKVVYYAADSCDSEDELDDDSEGDMPPKKKRASAKGKARKTRGKKKQSDDNSEDFMLDSDQEEDDDISDFDAESEEEEESRATKGSKKTASSSTKKDKPKKKMCDSFRPTNNPVYWDKKMTSQQIKEEFTYLDPCGMEATDDIVDSLIGEQLDKIGNLLKRALTPEDVEMAKAKKKKMINGEKERGALGSRDNPFILGTACSGTDAPSLALMLVQEQLEKRGMGDLFKHDHVFSCEKEQFKQAYLARNFDSILYPDIVKLIDEPPRDVYGQEKPIPQFNVFIAGTSCKNFSMLMGNKRKDIEDKQCSGETFLSACDVLFKEQPPYAIFENVTGAPWAKMQEYITGRIDISGKKDKTIKGGREGDLTFILVGKSIRVDNVPRQFGVRCGATVKGYVKDGKGKVHDISWPSSITTKRCKLSELAKFNNINTKTDLLVVENGVQYVTHLVKVDTKRYGLPQTRNRTYLFVWQPDEGNLDDDLGQYWEAIVKHLESPCRHGLEAFILQDDHEVIRTFCEALNGPSGRQSMRQVNLIPDYWNSVDKNLPHNVNTRTGIGMEQLARTQTSWKPFGGMHVPPHWWLEYIKCCNQRDLDMLEIMHASSARDALSKDGNFGSHCWNISQNASKEKHRSAVPGIATCITPGGENFLPHLGRLMLGSEKLLLQGIPYFRLLLGNETDVQLGDMAGNAMSLTVVCATMLAAMTCKQLRREHEASLSNSTDIMATLQSMNEVTALSKKPEACLIEGDTTDIKFLFDRLSKMAKAAIKTSVLCTCESSGRKSHSLNFLRCSVCSVSVCRDCVHVKQGHQLNSHQINEISLTQEEHDVSSFETSLRSLLPASIIMSKDGLNEVATITENDKYRVTSLSKYVFSLHRIKQSRLKWIIIYYARRDGTGEAVAEFKITKVRVCLFLIVGELEKRNKDSTAAIGAQGQLTSFLPARTEPIVLGPLPPCIIVRQYQGDSNLKWLVNAAEVETSLLISGSNPIPSFRVELGLTDASADSLNNHVTTIRAKKPFQAAVKAGDERRWVYPSNWKEWPAVITIKDNRRGDGNVGGSYTKVGCKHTFNQNACWIRKKTVDLPELYLLIKPDVSRVNPDYAIISTSTNHDDSFALLATLSSHWQPCDALNEKEKKQEVKTTLHNWIPLKTMSCSAFITNYTVESPPKDDSPILIKMEGLSDNDVTDLCCRDDVSGENQVIHLNVHRGAKVQQTVRRFNHLCVANFLKHAAETQLKYDLKVDAQWISIKPKNAIPFGCCKVTIPSRPIEQWAFNNEIEEWERLSEAGASRQYYLALEKAPYCFDFVADRKTLSLTVNCFPEVVAHHAAFGLIDGRGDGLEKEVSVTFRLSAHQDDPVLERFKLHNCQDLPETDVGLKEEFSLYERQRKAVTKMLRIEREEVTFDELEMSEQPMPGSTGWSLIAKATRRANLQGGVIADAIGAGKTLISIAIILNGIQCARANRSYPRNTSATLVVVPPGLIDQWRSEIFKFTDKMPDVLCIYDTEALKGYTLEQVLQADVVICPVDMLESKHYMALLSKTATSTKDTKSVPKLPSQTGQVESTAAKGVWIPHSSQDPYGGLMNPRSQKRREESAYFTHVYHNYIEKLRAKQFKREEKGIPLEYFEFERVIVDEIHEVLCTSKDEMKDAKEASKKDKDSGFFQEKNRRAGREFLGITTKDVSRRPLVFRKAIFGLTATPLLDSTNRVIELANLMGCAYITGLSNHWRNLEKESGRDIFLGTLLETKQSREIRKNIYAKCQEYLDVAACKNKNEEDMEGVELKEHRVKVRMSTEEGILYKKSQNGISKDQQSFAIKPEDFDPTAGHDISKFLRQNAKLACRGKKLVELCKQILSEDGNSRTKIIVFTDGRIGAGEAAREFLMEEEGLGCTWLDADDSVQVKNKKLAWYQYADVTEEDKVRPRVLVLHFAHAAGLNLQAECNNMILYTPLYVGIGSTSGDAVSDASTELQAIGRVFRPGQPKSTVNVYRLEILPPDSDGDEALDSHLIRRNTDKETIQMAVNADD